MGNKKEGYLGGIMGGESRVESGGGLKNTGILSLEEAGTQVVETSNIPDVGDLSLTSGLTLVSGTEVDVTAGSNSYEDAYLTLPTGTGFVYAEVHMYAVDESNIHQAVGLIKSTEIGNSQYGQVPNTAYTIRRNGTGYYRQNGATNTVSQNIGGRDAINTYHFVADLDTGDVWIGLTPAGSSLRWIRSSNAMSAAWASHLPTFSGLDLSVYDTFYFQQYYTTQSAWVNFSGNPLFDGQLSSGNDSSDWFKDPDASLSASSFTSGTAETLTLPQLSWGGITGRSVLTEGSSLVNTGIFTLEEIYELTKAVPQVDFATGGTVSDINVSGQDYRVHLFTTSGTFTVNTALTDVEYLVIGGGGGGGAGSGGPGGGGAGGYLEGTIASLSVGDQTITVGAGGAGATTISHRGDDGDDSSLGSFATATGGGGGGGRNEAAGFPGGSGGGGADYNSSTGTASAAGGAGASGQGYNGGSGNYNGSSLGGGGGGGAGAVGANGSSVGGLGGAGKSSSITGTSVTRAGGGGGTGTGSSRSGGSGGGGASATINTNNPGSDGTANTGSGGGGGTLHQVSPGNYAATKGGDGGSGVVIIRYKI